MQIPNTYHSTRLNSTHDGFVIFSYNDIKAYLTELCDQKGQTRGSSEFEATHHFETLVTTQDVHLHASLHNHLQRKRQ